MKTIHYNAFSRIGGFFSILLAGAFLMALYGCGGNYGRLKTSEDVTRIFEEHRVLPDYRYYFSGRENNPTGLIAIQKDYTLTTSIWEEVENMTPEKLKYWVEWLQTSFPDEIYPYGARGSYILSPSGERVGIWYSRQPWTVVKVYEGNRVAVFRPDDPGTRGGNGDKRVP